MPLASGFIDRNLANDKAPENEVQDQTARICRQVLIYICHKGNEKKDFERKVYRLTYLLVSHPPDIRQLVYSRQVRMYSPKNRQVTLYRTIS